MAGQLNARDGRSDHLVLLSELLRAPVLDAAGRRGSVLDLTIDADPERYPMVVEAVISRGKGERALANPVSLGPDGAIRVPSLDLPALPDDELFHNRVLLKRDVLDALVLDVAGQRAVRANDLWLRREDDALTVRGIDVSPWAVLRRLSRGTLGHGAERNIVDWHYVEYLRGDPAAAAQGTVYHRVITELAPPQIAWLAAALPYLHAAELLGLLPVELAADVLECMTLDRQTQIITELPRDAAMELIGRMAPDCAADLLGRLEVGDATALLERLPADRSTALQELLRYPPDTAGGIMTNDFVSAPVAFKVAEVIAHIRTELRSPDFVYYVYLVDDDRDRRLRGVVTLRDLIVADPELPVERTMASARYTARPLEPAREVAQRMSEYDLNAVPVLAPSGGLLGIITIDAALAQIAPADWRDNMPRVFS